jgi:type I restriction enzyme, S subunit
MVEINISKPEGYQETEVGIIPSSWKIKPLGDVSFMKGRIGWQGLKETEFTTNPEEPFLITGMNFKDGKIRWNEVYHVSWQRYDIAKEIQLQIGDVLMTKDGTIGKVLFVDTIPFPNVATLNSHLLVFRPLNNNYYPNFLYYQLLSKTFKNFIELNKSGTTFFGISQGSVSKYNAILPSIPEQTEIATALSDIDVLIENLEKLIAKKRNIKQGAMQELLTGRKRLAGFNGDWEEKPLREISYIKGRIGWQGLKETEFTMNAEEPFLITGMNFKDGNIRWDEVYHVSWERFEIAKEIQLKIGDVLMTKDGTIGKVLYVKNIPYPNAASLNSHLLVFRPLRKSYHPLFLYYQLSSKPFKDFVEFNKTGTTFFGISQESVSNYNVILPSLPEQEAISTILRDMDFEIEVLELKLQKYRMIKQGMMQVLLTGKIRLI